MEDLKDNLSGLTATSPMRGGLVHETMSFF